MKQKSSKKPLYVILAIVIIAGAIYFYLQGRSPAPVALETQRQSEVVGRDVNFLLAQIEALEIDANFFKSTAYKSLVDHEVLIPDQNVSRPNPFAPIPGVSTTPLTGAPLR